MAAMRMACSLLPNIVRCTSRSHILSPMSWSKLLTYSNIMKENRFCSSVPKPQQQKVTVIFIDRDGDRIVAQAKVGASLLTVAIENDVELEGAKTGNHFLLKSTHTRTDMCILKFPFHYLQPKIEVKIIFTLRDGRKQAVNAKVGDNLLDVITENDLDIDGFGACEGTLACSTCHLIFKDEDFAKIPDKPTDEELDMLDLAYGLTDTSRLGCQVIVTKDMEGLEITVPRGVADARSPQS